MKQRVLALSLVMALGVVATWGRPARTQPSSTAPAARSIYLSNRLLSLIKLVLNRPERFLKLKQLHPGEALDELKLVVDQHIKEKTIDSIAVLVLHVGPHSTAAIKMQSDLTLQSVPLAWSPAVVLKVAELAEFFRKGGMVFDQGLSRMVNGVSGLDEGWAQVQRAKDDPFMAPELAATLADAYANVLRAKRTELNTRVQARDPRALEITKFFNASPAKLTDGKIEWNGLVPYVAERDLGKLKERFEALDAARQNE